MAARSRSHRGQGIYRAMRLEINNIARRHQYKYVVGELSSAIKQKVLLDKMGQLPGAEIRSWTFLHRGDYPFGLIEDPKSIVFSDYKLQARWQRKNTHVVKSCSFAFLKYG